MGKVIITAAINGARALGGSVKVPIFRKEIAEEAGRGVEVGTNLLGFARK